MDPEEENQGKMPVAMMWRSADDPSLEGSTLEQPFLTWVLWNPTVPLVVAGDFIELCLNGLPSDGAGIVPHSGPLGRASDMTPTIFFAVCKSSILTTTIRMVIFLLATNLRRIPPTDPQINHFSKGYQRTKNYFKISPGCKRV